MSITRVKNICCGCSSCVATCPTQCLSMVKDEEGFYYPAIKQDDCIGCNKCEKVCPVINVVHKPHNIVDVVAAKTKLHDIQIKSSSGGLFYHLARKVISMGGVVCGAAFQSDFMGVEHRIIDNEADLHILMGSKYIQSRVNIHKEVEQYLQQGTAVLFSGTPCQINGLKRYLKKDYESLYCISVICHGVPSEMLWQHYLKWRCRNKHSNPAHVSFRDKRYGLEYFGIAIGFDDNSEIFQPHGYNEYMNLFLKDYALRPSCYECEIKIDSNLGDMTIGDLWGVSELAPELYDNFGVSVAIIHNTRGKSLFSQIEDEVQWRTVDYSGVIAHNSCAIKSCSKPKERETFYRELGLDSFAKVKKKYCKVTLKQRLYRKTKMMAKDLGMDIMIKKIKPKKR